MKQSQHTTSSELKTTANDVVRWVMELRHLHARMAPFFARSEPRQRCLLYLQGILSDVARKNGWQLAEQAGETRPDGMQRRLRNAVWDESRVRDELRTYVLQRLGAEHAIVAIDETSFRQQRRQVGWSCTAILWEQQTSRKLSGGSLSVLH
jgi:SRSO17 transposase